MGRKPKPEAERRERVVFVRVNDAEYATIEAGAKSAGLSPAVYARMVTLKQARKDVRSES